MAHLGEQQERYPDTEGEPRKGIALPWDSCSLLNYIFDSGSERVIFPGLNGIAVYHMPDGELRHIAAAWPGDIPIALDARHERLAWLTTDDCGHDSPERGRQRICLATLDWSSR